MMALCMHNGSAVCCKSVKAHSALDPNHKGGNMGLGRLE